MATVSAFPTPSNGGPVITKQMELPEEFQPTIFEYDDGGVDVNVLPCGVRRWQIEYEGLTAAEADTLDDHFNLAKGQVNDFSFFDSRAGVIETGVHYERYEVPRHEKQWAVNRRIQLVKFAE